MKVLRLPLEWDSDRGKSVMIGPKGRGIASMRGKTDCRVDVCISWYWTFVFVSGESLEDTRECIKRARSRIHWAESRYNLYDDRSSQKRKAS